MKQNRLYIFVILLVATAFGTSAQDNLSPYSRYGYGNLRDNATSAQRAMGGVGYAMQSGRQINVMNPASYAAIDSLTFLFDMGINMTRLWASDEDNKTKNFGGGLDYITMQFPVGKIMGASFGLLPYSSTGYSFGDQISNGSNAFQGSGSINLLYAGVAIRPYIPGFSVGANISYMFGTTRNDNYVYTTSGSTSLFERVMEVRDYHLQFGAQYGINFTRDLRATLGVTYSPGKDFRGKTYGIKYDVNADATPDTIQTLNLRGNYSMPDTWGAGLNVNVANKLMVEVDYTYQPWKNVRYATLEGYEGTRFDNRWKIAVGAEYTPNFRGNWIQRVNYRIGAFHDNDYIMIGDNNVRRRGVTLGFGLPAPRSKTVLNLGLEYSTRRAYPNPLVKENYLFITLGINFNESWFHKSRLH